MVSQGAGIGLSPAPPGLSQEPTCADIPVVGEKCVDDGVIRGSQPRERIDCNFTGVDLRAETQEVVSRVIDADAQTLRVFDGFGERCRQAVVFRELDVFRIHGFKMRTPLSVDTKKAGAVDGRLVVLVGRGKDRFPVGAADRNVDELFRFGVRETALQEENPRHT